MGDIAFALGMERHPLVLACGYRCAFFVSEKLHTIGRLDPIGIRYKQSEPIMPHFLMSKLGLKSAKNKHDIHDDILHRLSSRRYQDQGEIERLFDDQYNNEAIESK